MPLPEIQNYNSIDHHNDADEASQRFHLEINLSQDDTQKLAAGATFIAVAAITLAVGSRMKLGARIIESAQPTVEDLVHEVWAGSIRLVRTEPKLNYFELSSGI